MEKVKYSNTEELVFNLVNKYISGKKFEFYFSSNVIYLIDNEDIIEIKMADFYESIAIYNRFSDKTGIFDKEPKNELLVFLNRYYNYRGIPYYTKIEEIQDGIFVDITIMEAGNEEIKKIYDLYISQINDKIKKINKDSNEAIIISLMVYSSVEDNGNHIGLGENIYHMPIDYYRKNMFTKIINQTQYPIQSGSIEISYYDENFSEKIDYFSENRIYDLEKNVYYTTEPVIVQNGNSWTAVDQIIKTYNAISGELLKEESLTESEKSHAIMNNMYN